MNFSRVEKFVKQAFCPTLGIEFLPEGREIDHNILGVAPIY